MTAFSEPSASPVAGDDIVAFIEALDAAQAVLRSIGDQALGDLGGGITTTQLRLLDRLARLGESRLIDLADALSIAPSTATRLCDTLAERQLIERHRRGRDRRELQIRLTPAGTHLLEAVRHRTMSEWTQALVHVTTDERRYVTRALKEISAPRDNGAAEATRVLTA